MTFLHSVREAPLDYNQNETFIDAFLRQVENAPDAAAVMDEFGSITYGELDGRSDFIAAELLKMGVKGGDFVAIKLPRVKEFLVAVLGIWKAGGAYMPVDPTYPEERIRYMMEDSGAKVTIDESWMGRLRNGGGDIPSPVNNARLDGIAIIIYTSGSTGRPKGALNTHSGVRGLCSSMNAIYEYVEGDVIAEIPSFSYVISCSDLFPPLIHGHTVFILNHSLLADIAALDRYIRENGITIITIVPQIGIPLINDFNTPLRAIGMGGAKVELSKQCDIRIISGYGLSETCSAVSFVDLLEKSAGNGPLLGRPTPGVTMVLEDEDGNPVPRGEIGEVCIASPQVAAGYWHKEELTGKVFVKRPWSEYRVFRSGDLARWNEDGVLEFHGRRDDMVKIRGNRVELGEVESALLKVKGVRAGTVAMKEVGGESLLCGYYVSAEPVSIESIRASMSEFLPPYMIPSFFVRLEALPKLPNGKLDRLSLPVPDVSMSEKSENIVAPESEFERKVFPAVAREIGIENFGVTTNLISLGLTSLRAIRLSSALKSELGISVPQTEMLAHPVIREWEVLCGEAVETVPVGPVREYYPLTDNQMGLYVEWERNREADMYNLPFVLKITGGDTQKLMTSVQEVIKLYPILKMHIGERDGSPVQMRRDDAELTVGFEKLDFEPDDVFFGKLVRPFNLLVDDLARFNVYSSPSAAWLFFDVHHIIFDGGSVNLFLNALSSVYRGVTPSEESVTVYDYSLYREKWQGSEEFAEYGRYFEKLLEETESFNYPSLKNGTVGGAAGTVTVTIPRKGIRSFCSVCGVTENSFFATVLTQVFHRISREDAVQIATVSNGRATGQLSAAIGMFVQTLPLVSRSCKGVVSDVLKSMQSQIFETIGHDKYPFTKLAEKYGLKTNVLYIYQGDLLDIESDFSFSSSAELIPLKRNTVKTPLEINVMPAGDHYDLKIDYDAGMYDEGEIRILEESFAAFAESLSHTSFDADISSVDLISVQEKDEVIKLGTGEVHDYGSNETFIDKFFKTVETSPDSVAVSDAVSSITYRELDLLSDAMAAKLIEWGIKQNDFVAVQMPRYKEFIISVLGIWKAGGAYVPVDPEYPDERRAFMVEDCEAKVVLTPATFTENDFSAVKCSRINLSTPEGVAYMIYTSGSTGKPKGVMIQHKAYFNYLNFYARQQGLTSTDRMGCHRHFCFDASLEDLYPILTVGGELHLMPDEIRKDLFEIRNFIVNRKLTCISFTTSLGEMVLQQYPDLPLRFMVVSGEKLNPIEDLRLPLWNFYGPTECTVDCVTCLVEKDRKYRNVPIGKVVDNLSAVILDKADRLVPRGVAGELCIIGPQLSKGYWKRPELTAEKFALLPEHIAQALNLSGKKGLERMYRTGDLARWNERGEMEYLGRIDHQVKLRGFRVEMGEIEVSLSKIEGIGAAVAQVKVINGIEHLCAYYMSDSAIDESVLRTELSKSLAEYMVPDVYVHVEAFPMTPSGKIDRKRLPEPEIKVSEIVVPESDLEKKLFGIVASELKTENFGVTTNLITLGLASIRAIRLSVAIRKETGLVLRGTDMVSHPTVREWCGMGEGGSEKMEIGPVQEYYPLTDNQLGVYVDWEQHRDGIQYNVPSAMKFAGMDARKVVAAVREVIAFHPCLKTGIVQVGDGVMQRRRDDARLNVLYEHLESEPSAEFFQSRVRPFNLLEDDLARFEVYQTETASYLFYDIHHIIFDGGAVNIFLSDLSKSLSGAALEYEKVNAFDYALHYDGWKKTERFGESERYFDDLVSDTESFLYPVSKQTDLHPERSGRCAARTISIPSESIRRFCRSLGITENVYFTIVLTQVFHRISRDESIQIATISNGRSMEQLSETMGMFVQTLPLVSRHGRGKVSDILKRMQRQLFDTIRNEKYPFTLLSERHGLKPNVLYAYQGDVIDYDALSGLGKVEIIPLSLDTAKVPISVNVFPEGGNHALTIEYDEGMYSESDMAVFGNALSVFAVSLAETSLEEDISSVGLTTTSDVVSLTALGTGEKLEYDSGETFIDQFLRSVRQYPDSVAVVDAASSITYRELDEKSNALAARLIELGVGKDTFVSIMLPRVKEFLVAVLGVWKAGGAYLPLGSEYPKERLKFMLEDAQAQIMITESDIWSEMSDAGLPANTVLKLDEFDFGTASTPVNNAVADGLAYMIYTSGSTGRPKGTMLEHRNLRAFNEWLVKLAEMKPGDAITEHASFSFDGSCLDLYPALTVGGQVHILNDDLRRDMPALVDYFNAHHIKGCFLTTRLAQELLNNFDLPLDYMMMGGEKNFGFRPSKVKVYEVYGPTETTILATVGLTDQTFPDIDNIPIGRPAPNLTMFIVDGNGQLVPRGMAGELCISGPQVARGYWKQPELTAEKFVEAHFADGVRMYRTGDLCRWDENGNILFLGRIDNQVKLRGFRIEMGEVDSALLKYPGIKEAVSHIVTVNGIQHLCAYYVSDSEIDETALKAELSETLTDYMVPTAFLRMETLPLNPNGKVDYKSLPLPVIKSSEYVAPANEIEQTIADAFCNSLNLSDPVGREDGFYALGGDSIKAIRVVSHLRQEGLTVTVSQIIKYQTVSRLAEVAETTDEGEDFAGYFDMMNIPVEESFSSEEEYESVRAEFEKRGETIERAYPLTSMQEGMLLTALSEPESSAYHITFRISLGILPTEKQLSYALEKLLSKREVLRTAIIHQGVSEPHQAIVGGRKLPLSFADLSSEKDIEAAILAYDRREFIRKIDLQWDSLFRCTCIKTGADSCQLLFSVHHAIVDGWCTALWTGDLFTYLTEAVKGRESEEDFSEGYGRYERHVRDILSRDREEALNYWKELLSGYETKAEIPAYEKVTEANRSSENEIKVSLSAEATGKLETLCRENGCTVNNAVEAAWGLVLQAYNRTDDAVFVKVVSGRDNSREDMSDVVGLFINSVPVRVKREENATLLDIMKGCQRQAAETSEHDWVPLSEIQQQSELGSNLFQSILAFENYETGSGLSASSEDVLKMKMVSGHETNISEITIAAYVGGDSLVLDLKFDTEKYTASSIHHLLTTFECVLLEIAAHPESRVSAISLAEESAVNELLRVGTAGELEYDRSETFVDQFLRSVRQYPDSVAVVDAASSITYRELDEKSNILASRLIELGVGKDTFVSIMLPRVKEFEVAVLGVWKAGGAYLPLGSEYPKERLKFMLEDAQAQIMITESGIWSEMSDAGLPAKTVIKLDEFDYSGSAVSVNNAVADGLAYMIYTSGSTGKPKGTMLEHWNLRAFNEWLVRSGEIGAGDAISVHASFSFDGSCLDLYPALTMGGQVHILSKEVREDMSLMDRYFRENHIKGCFLTARLAGELLNSFDLSLDYLMAGGEKVVPFRPCGVRVMNAYGPTECTILSTCGPIDQSFPEENIPLGRPVPNTYAVIVDTCGHIVPRGMAGELCLCGPQIARGYWKRPELTAEKFCESPFYPGERMYKTGDIAFWNEKDELVCLGRTDDQVKLRGFRIEMGEIETALSKFDGITSAVAEVKTVNGIQHLCAYYVADEPVNETVLKSELSTSLAAYMVPDTYVRMESLPMTPNGKVDRRALPEPEFKPAEMVPAATRDEEILLKIARELLGTDGFGVTDSLVEYGMNSITAIKFVAAASKEDIILKVGDLLQNPTVRAAASSHQTFGYWYAPYRDGSPVVVFTCGVTTWLQASALLESLSRRYNVFVFEALQGHFDAVFSRDNVDNVIMLYSTYLEQMLPEGVKVAAFGGHSFGGELAVRMTSEYSQSTGETPALYLWDTWLAEYGGQESAPTEEQVDALLNATHAQMDVMDEQIKFAYIIDILKNGASPLPVFTGQTTYFRALGTTGDIEANRLALSAHLPNLRIINIDADHFSILSAEKSEECLEKMKEE